MKKNNKRVCVVRHSYYPECTRMFKEVNALTGAGYEVDLICLNSPNKPADWVQIGGLRIYRLPHSHRRGSKARYAIVFSRSILQMGLLLCALWFRRRYACIQVNTLPDALVFITWLPRLFGTRILLDLHEPTPELLLSKYNGQVSKSFLKLQMLVEQQAIRYAHRVITVNDTIRQRFIERGADPDKISVVRNVPPEDFDAQEPPHRPHDGLVLMTHGTLQPRYGHDLLLRTLPLLRGRFNDIRLIVAGLGETRKELERLAAQLKCDDIVTFTGGVPRNDIARLIVNADIGIVPLLPGPFSELCQPNKLFEYMAFRVPVIAARMPAIEESFDDSCIQYFKAGDAEDLVKTITALAENPQRRELLAAAAFARYQTLCWRGAKKEYIRIIDDLIKSGRPRRTPERSRHED